MVEHRIAEAKKPQRVVLLGGSGFIGKALNRHLSARGIGVLSVSSRDVDLLGECSVRELPGILKPRDTVVFLSCLTPDRGKDADTLMKNFRMALHFEKAAVPELAHFVYISSDAVFDDSVGLIRESSPRFSSSLYGYMHIGRELMLGLWAKSRNIPCLVLRPVAVYGHGDPHQSYGPNRFIRTAAEQKKITLFGNGDEKRDHLYLEDLARLVAECLARQTVGELNVATGKAVPFSDVASLIRNAYKKLGGTEVEIERKPRTGPVTHRHFDNTDLIRAFPTFGFTPLAEAIHRVLEARLQPTTPSAA